MFLLNSRSHQFIATPSPSWRRPVKLQGRTLSRSYGTNLPSSFSRVLSSALEYSSRPPVSVCGTVIVRLKLRGFSWNHFQLLRSLRSSRHTLELRARICLSAFSNAATGTSNTRTTFRDPSPIASNNGAGILTCFPSATHFCLALGADSPYADERCVGNLGLTARGPFTPLSLLMSAFALPIPPAPFTRHLRRLTERSPTMRASSHPQLRYIA